MSRCAEAYACSLGLHLGEKANCARLEPEVDVVASCVLRETAVCCLALARSTSVPNLACARCSM